MLFVGLNDFLYQGVAHDIHLLELNPADPGNAINNRPPTYQA